MLSCQKQSFEIPAAAHYLNCAYMAPLPRRVEEAGIAGVRRKREPFTIEAEDFFTESDRLRAVFARLIGAGDPRRVAIMPSVSYGMATVARNLTTGRGGNVVIAHEQFPSNVYAWRALAKREDLEIRTVAPPENSARRGQGWNERLLEAIDGSTALVALGHVHWADGTRFDLERIGERAREVGAAFVVDGTQSVGALPFDLDRIRPDALVCAGYKWLLGPYGIALAYLGPRFEGGVPLEETWTARLGSEDFRGLVQYHDEYGPGAVRFDVGERSNFILVPMLIAAIEQILEWGVAEVQEYCRTLIRDLVAGAKELGYTVEEERWRASHLFGLRLPRGLDPDTVADALRERNVFVSVRGDSLRISPHLYNDRDDVAALLDALRGVAAGRHAARPRQGAA